MNIKDIIKEFRLEFEKFKKFNHPEPTAMTLSTASLRGQPSSRIVLLKDFDEQGFVFFTNYTSRKAREIEANPCVALNFVWHETDFQVRIEGQATKVSPAESDAYFASRNRQSQIGAWASKQSSEIAGSLDFEKRIAKYTLKFGIGKIPRPEFWGGFRVVPECIEFWQKKDFRLHERRVFSKDLQENWSMKRIYP